MSTPYILPILGVGPEAVVQHAGMRCNAAKIGLVRNSVIGLSWANGRFGHNPSLRGSEATTAGAQIGEMTAQRGTAVI